MKTKLSARVLGQIALMQSVVSQLPTTKAMLDFICAGLLEIPGVCEVTHEHKATHPSETHDGEQAHAPPLDQGDDEQESSDTSIATLPIRSDDITYALLHLKLDEPEAFAQYRPFVLNFATMLGTILEERRQRALLQEIQQELEQRVEARTRALEEAKARADLYLNNIETILVVLDKQGDVELLNRKGYQLLGYEPGSLEGANWLDHVLPPEDRDELKALYIDIVEGKHPPYEYYENSVQTRTGAQRHIAWHNNLLHNAQGEIIGTICAGEDITERHRAEQALRENEEDLRVTLNSIGDAVISTDTECRIRRLNTVAQTLTGWTQEEAVGRPLTEVFHITDHKGQQKNPALEVLKTGKIVALGHPATLRARDGKELLIGDSAAPIRNTDNQVTGAVLVFRDVTEQVHLQNEALKAQRLRSLGTLAGGIAHDFNNMLAGLFGHLELAMELVHPTHEANEHLGQVFSSITNAKHLTRQLLTFAKGGSPIKESVSLAALIEESTRFSLRGSPVHVALELADGLWKVEADRGQLDQVLSNLAINAKQAMPEGGQLTIRASNVQTPQGPMVELKVQDTGQGIDPAHIDEIFDPYFTTKNDGSGLGLTTVHSIIHKHKGSIRVESSLAEGTTFTILLPATHPAETPALTPPPLANLPTRPSRILVMDDEAMLRKMLEKMLDRLGHTAQSCGDGQSTIETYQRALEEGTPFDLVIMDLTMPGNLNGKLVAQELLRLDPNARLVISSGYANNNPIMARYKEFGFQGALAKPYRFRDLRALVTDMLQPPR